MQRITIVSYECPKSQAKIFEKIHKKCGDTATHVLLC